MDQDLSLDALRARLADLRAQLENDPLANPVRRMAHDLSRAIEAGRLTLDDTEAMISELACEAARQRKERGAAYLAESGTLSEAISLLTDGVKEPEEFARRLEKPLETIVFTGHPTFAMDEDGGFALRGKRDIAEATTIRTGITLAEEHREARRALAAGADAIVAASREALKLASERYGDAYKDMLPLPVSLATWVGYDLDGRQDISWTRIFCHRLIEKAEALADYIARLDGFASVEGVAEVKARLQASLDRSQKLAEIFSDDENLKDPQDIAAAANRLTADDAERLVSLRLLIADLRKAAKGAGDQETTIGLLGVAALMKARGLGLGEIHFRLNASQIRNASRALIPISRDADLFGHTALQQVNEAIAGVVPVRVNFGSLATETSSARRIAIAAAQITKHIDGDTPIRLLIAECENPVTVLTAIYLSRRYGADKLVDVCPLFETAKSFDRSRRILDVLLAQPAYREQVEQRGRVSIEAGFSDAGRFMGQLSATLAIERLQVQLADEMERNGLGHLEAVIFNTHGESMGRGGHPTSILDRSRYAMSPYARKSFENRGIRLCHEISFQGGDGYSWFASDEAAEAVVAGLLRALTGNPDPDKDPFYERYEASLDFYNTVRKEQIDLFEEEAMATVAMGPGLSLLPPAGSRKTKRQFERSGEEEISLRRIRAISHNGSLQQIGYVANIHAGVGEAISTEPEAYEDMAETSDRFRRLMKLVARAAQLSDMKTLIAYMKLYDGSFWATRPISGGEPQIEKACGDLATHLVGDRRYFAALELAARLRPGAITLKWGLKSMGFEDLDRAPANLDLLHALRIALMQHMFLLGARLPSFARAGGFSRPEVLDEILALDVDRAVQQLREGFPQRQDTEIMKLFDEPADDDGSETGYAAIERDTIAPLERTFNQCRRISLAVAHHFGAHG
ncbi:phosphoenolpyruvate carboxylase [Parvularcula sp. ZS-1/3]|uniref:Phosphoenolpyruvate carboxylase n=1 Tax=Parvularcula mediterranea TaxID=2732508 RepID=A0A7Y3RLK5_9PROT|nr:phosphoenolpyruvate carboxylase [Parvularcula mediterranea]NNU16337.1 phosphoenolpyruvate carboxylase [Parvularcula mediterranea]